MGAMRSFLIRVAYLYPETRSILLDKLASITETNLKKKLSPAHDKFSRWVKKQDEGRGFKSPKTGKNVKFNSLPKDEQKRIRESFYKKLKRTPLRFMTKREKLLHDKKYEEHIGQHKRKLDKLIHGKENVKGLFLNSLSTEIDKVKTDLEEGKEKYLKYRRRLDRKRKIKKDK